jgi:hypothetical protein
MSHKQSASRPKYSFVLEERETAFEQLLDRLVKRFEIADREMLKVYIRFAEAVYGSNPGSRLSKDDLDQLRDLAPKLAGALRRNAGAIAKIIMKLEPEPKPEPNFMSAYNQGGVDGLVRQIISSRPDFTARILKVPDTLMELVHVLSQHHRHPVVGRPPNLGLLGAVVFLQRYWRDRLGRRVKAEPWKRGMFGEFLKAVFEFIDPAAVAKLPSAMKQARTLDKNTP